MKRLTLGIIVSIISFSQAWADCGWVLWHREHYQRGLNTIVDLAKINDAYETRADCIKNLKRDDFTKTLSEKKLDSKIGEATIRVTIKEESPPGFGGETVKTTYFYCLPAGTLPPSRTDKGK